MVSSMDLINAGEIDSLLRILSGGFVSRSQVYSVALLREKTHKLEANARI